MLVYTTGVINEVDAATVGATMANTIRDDVAAHDAWSVVEQFTAAGGAVNWVVFKCDATESGLSADFYVIMGRTLATGELRFSICETYTAATHTMQYLCPAESLSNINFDANGRDPATYVLGTVAFPHKYNNWVPSGTTSKWWIIVAEDGLTIAFNGAANAFVHVGAYFPLSVLVNDLPLQITGSSDGSSGITRNPAVASTTYYAYSMIAQAGGSTPGSSGPILGFRGDLRYLDKLQGNQVPVAEQGMNVMNFPADTQATRGWALGKQKRMRIGGTVPSSFAFGDAYVVDGTLWVPYLPTDPRMWDTGVGA